MPAPPATAIPHPTRRGLTMRVRAGAATDPMTGKIVEVNTNDIARWRLDHGALLLSLAMELGLEYRERTEEGFHFLGVAGEKSQVWFAYSAYVARSSLRLRGLREACGAALLAILTEALPADVDWVRALAAYGIVFLEVPDDGAMVTIRKDLAELAEDHERSVDARDGWFDDGSAKRDLTPIEALGGHPAGVLSVACASDGRAFEDAVHPMLSAIFGPVIRLGSRYPGTPVPDGVLQCSGDNLRVACYDCKATAGGEYQPSADDARELASYWDWLTTCCNVRDRATAILLLAGSFPNSAPGTLASLETWRPLLSALSKSGGRLLLLSAHALAHGQEIAHMLGDGTAYLDHATAFRLIVDEDFGVVPPAVRRNLPQAVSNPLGPIRVVTAQMIELGIVVSALEGRDTYRRTGFPATLAKYIYRQRPPSRKSAWAPDRLDVERQLVVGVVEGKPHLPGLSALTCACVLEMLDLAETELPSSLVTFPRLKHSAIAALWSEALE